MAIIKEAIWLIWLVDTIGEVSDGGSLVHRLFIFVDGSPLSLEARSDGHKICQEEMGSIFEFSKSTPYF
jgi:hypothetical protein